jgi:hypothetical protein
MIRWIPLIAFVCGLVWGSAAVACTVIVPMPGPGETFELAALRSEREHQRTLMAHADAIYLARSTQDGEARASRLSTIASVSGARPPRRSTIRDTQGCGGWSGPRGTVIVFAAQIGMRDDPWKPWRWGRWVVIGWIAPTAVVAPELVTSLRETAQRLESERG